jgi:hypothetical protein
MGTQNRDRKIGTKNGDSHLFLVAQAFVALDVMDEKIGDCPYFSAFRRRWDVWPARELVKY